MLEFTDDEWDVIERVLLNDGRWPVASRETRRELAIRIRCRDVPKRATP